MIEVLENRCWSVYKHTSPSNKIYIGITSKEPKERWMSGYGYRRNDHFNKAIKKYGWENILHEVLYTNLTQEEAETKERELIAKYKSNNRKYGYNNDNGGIYGGCKKTEEEKLHQSQDKKEKWARPEYRKMVLEKLVAKHGLKVKCIETGKKYKSLTEASKDINGYARKIKQCCNGIIDTYRGCHWEFWGNNWFRNTENYKYRVNSQKVSIYDLEGNYIKTFASVEEASRETNINADIIRRRIKGLKNRKGNIDLYIWKCNEEGVE